MNVFTGSPGEAERPGNVGLIPEVRLFRRNPADGSPHQHGWAKFAVIGANRLQGVPSPAPCAPGVLGWRGPSVVPLRTLRPRNPVVTPGTCLVATVLLPCCWLVLPRWIRSTSGVLASNTVVPSHPPASNLGATPRCSQGDERHKSFVLTSGSASRSGTDDKPRPKL